MLDLAQMDAAKQKALIDYPKESKYVRWGMTASIGAHVLFALIVLILAWWNHIHDLRELMTSAIAMEPPPNEIEVVLPPDDTPPPPTDHPLFIKQIIQVPKPPPLPKPKIKPPPPKPTPVIQHPHPAVSRGPAQSQLVVGSSHFPQPSYTYALRKAGVSGPVGLSLTFDASGGISEAEVIAPNGSSLINNYTVQFVKENWHNPDFANRHVNVTVIYRPTGG